MLVGRQTVAHNNTLLPCRGKEKNKVTSLIRLLRAALGRVAEWSIATSVSVCLSVCLNFVAPNIENCGHIRQDTLAYRLT